jgi:hypothetical protein
MYISITDWDWRQPDRVYVLVDLLRVFRELAAIVLTREYPTTMLPPPLNITAELPLSYH